MRYARIAPANMQPQFAYPFSGNINPLPEHLLPIALCTVFTVCPDLHTCTATGLSSLYYLVRTVQRCPYATYDQYVHGPPSGDVSTVVCTLCQSQIA
jgi:hypothetical protein